MEELSIVALIIFFVILVKNQKVRKWIVSKISTSTTGVDKTISTIFIGLAITNLIVWSSIDWLWNILYPKWYIFLILNGGVGALIYFKVQKTLVSDSVTAIIKWVLILVLITNLVNFGQFAGGPYGDYVKMQAIKNTPLILRKIRDCNEDSKDFQMDEKGVFPALKQFKESGTAPWSDSVECWAKDLTFEGNKPIVITIVAPTDKWSGKILRPNGRYSFDIDWEDKNRKFKFKVEFTVSDGKTIIEKEYPSKTGEKDNFDGVDGMRFQSTDTKPHNIKITFNNN